MVVKYALRISGLVLLLAAYGICYSHVDQLRSNLPPETKRAQALAVDPTLLKVVSGPFKNLMADYLIVKASVFMGGAWQVTEEDWEAVYTLLKQSLYLDPLFFQTGYYIQGLLSWRANMQPRATELLQYHAEHRYWDWEPMFYVGFNYYYHLKDFESAAKFMQLSAERQGAPPVVASLAARAAQRTGQTLTAIALLKTMYESSQDEKSKAYYAKRLEAQLAVYAIEQAIDVFKKRHGHRPSALEDLLNSGTIKQMPQNPFKVPFDYDPDTGSVSFDEGN